MEEGMKKERKINGDERQSKRVKKRKREWERKRAKVKKIGSRR